MYKASILLVEDSVLYLHAIKSILIKLGYNCITATNKMEAIEKLLKYNINLILANIYYGLDLYECIKSVSYYNSIPIIIMLSQATLHKKKLVYEAGITEIIVKPFSERQLLALLKRLLSAKIP